MGMMIPACAQLRDEAYEEPLYAAHRSHVTVLRHRPHVVPAGRKEPAQVVATHDIRIMAQAPRR